MCIKVVGQVDITVTEYHLRSWIFWVMISFYLCLRKRSHHVVLSNTVQNREHILFVYSE